MNLQTDEGTGKYLLVFVQLFNCSYNLSIQLTFVKPWIHGLFF